MLLDHESWIMYNINRGQEWGAMTAIKLPLVRTKQQGVYEVLREHIVNGDLRPGQRLIIDELARQLGVSNVPVREALKLLEAEQLVVMTPHVGARVAPLDPEALDELFLIRAPLEDLAVRLATPRITATDLAELARLSQAMRALTDADPARDWRELNFQFHARIHRCAGRPLLADLLRNLWERSYRVAAFKPVVPSIHDALCDDHDRLLDALRAGDADRAAAVAREHVARARLRFRQYFAELPVTTGSEEGATIS